MATPDKKGKSKEKPEKRFKIPWFVIVLLVFGFILGGGAVFQRFMLSKDAETYQAPGILLENVMFIAEEGTITEETMNQMMAGLEDEAALLSALDASPSLSTPPSPSPSPSISPSVSPTAPSATVSGITIHTFVTGIPASSGKPSVLLLGGWGTASPVLDYEPLIAQLKDKAHVIAIERPGYGWSGEKYTERTLDNMLGETRAVLNQLRETGPYVIVAHTTAGLEAIHFAAKHTNEVSGIVFINAMAPAAYSYRVNGFMDFVKGYSYQVPKYTGIFRAISMFAPQLFTTGPNVDAESYAAMYCKNIISSAMRAEAAMLSKNAKTALFDGIPSVPAVAFIDTNDYNANPELSRVWGEFNSNIGAKVFESDVGSYIHGINTDAVAAEILKMTG